MRGKVRENKHRRKGMRGKANSVKCIVRVENRGEKAEGKWVEGMADT